MNLNFNGVFLKNLWYVVGVSKTSKKLNFIRGYYNPQ